jgi:hypothetical protein
MDQSITAVAPTMKCCSPNIGRAGRIVRGLLGSLLIIAGVVASRHSLWFCALLIGLGVFGLFEAARGWCLARACGIKTRL